MKAGEVLKKITPYVSSISLVGWLLALTVQGGAWIYQTYFSFGDVVIAAVPICERYSFGPEVDRSFNNPTSSRCLDPTRHCGVYRDLLSFGWLRDDFRNGLARACGPRIDINRRREQVFLESQ